MNTNEQDMQENEKSKLNIMVCLSASPSNRRVIRTARKMYNPERDSFTALYVGSSEEETDTDPQRRENIEYAERCGAEVHVIISREIAVTISEYAKQIGATDLFIGNSAPPHVMTTRSIPDRIVSYLPETDIHIIPDQMSSSYPKTYRKGTGSPWNLNDFVRVVLVMAVATLLSYWFDQSRYSNANIITIYILAVLIASVITSHQVYGIIAAFLYVMLFNYLFIDPRYTLLVYDSAYLMTYCVTVLAALITGSLAVKLKNIAKQSAENAYQAKVLLETSTRLEKARDRHEMIRITCMQLSNLLKRTVMFYEIEGDTPKLTAISYEEKAKEHEPPLTEEEKKAILWTYQNNHHSGAYTRHFPDSPYRYLSVYNDTAGYGVIAIRCGEKNFTEFENTILLSIVNEFTLTLNNEVIRMEKKEAEINAEKEYFRAGLLRSISHDLRTPLTAIYGNAVNLSTNHEELTEADKEKIYEDMQEDTSWLVSQMENILSMTRLENRSAITTSAENVEDVIEESLKHLDMHASEHHIECVHPEEMLFAEMDAKLIMQVIVNLVNNAVKYTPPGSHIIVSAEKQDQLVCISVADDGPGIPAEDREHIFELFWSGRHDIKDGYRSMGIGLNLCRMIMKAHGQKIEALDNEPHGTIFRFYLPLKGVESYEGL